MDNKRIAQAGGGRQCGVGVRFTRLVVLGTRSMAGRARATAKPVPGLGQARKDEPPPAAISPHQKALTDSCGKNVDIAIRVDVGKDDRDEALDRAQDARAVPAAELYGDKRTVSLVCDADRINARVQRTAVGCRGVRKRETDEKCDRSEVASRH